MAQSINVTPGYQLAESEPLTREVLNQMARPTVELEGLVEESSLADDAVTPDKIADDAVTAAKIADDAGLALTQLEAVTAGQVAAGRASDGQLAGHTVAGDQAAAVTQRLPFDAMTDPGFAAGQTIEGATSGATATIASVDLDGDDYGYLEVTGISGTFEDDENILVTNILGYDDLQSGHAFAVGDLVTGGTSGATGIVTEHDTDDDTLTLAHVSGVFEDNEELQVNGVAVKVALAKGPWGVRGVVDLDGKTVDDGTVLALAAGRTIHQPDLGARAVALNNLRPGGTSGQVLTSAGPETAPSWQSFAALPGALVVADDCSNAAVNLAPMNISQYSAAADTITFNDPIPAGLVDGDVVAFSGSTLPGALSKGVVYYVRDKDAVNRTIKLAATAGGDAIDLTGAGGSLDSVYLHKRIATGYNCSLFRDTKDGSSTTTGYFQLIFTSALASINQVIFGNSHDSASGDRTSGANCYVGLPVIWTTPTTTHLRFVMFNAHDPVAAYYLTVGVFALPA